jgi:hypothetical protein
MPEIDHECRDGSVERGGGVVDRLLELGRGRRAGDPLRLAR